MRRVFSFIACALLCHFAANCNAATIVGTFAFEITQEGGKSPVGTIINGGFSYDSEAIPGLQLEAKPLGELVYDFDIDNPNPAAGIDTEEWTDVVYPAETLWFEFEGDRVNFHDENEVFVKLANQQPGLFNGLGDGAEFFGVGTLGSNLLNFREEFLSPPLSPQLLSSLHLPTSSDEILWKSDDVTSRVSARAGTSRSWGGVGTVINFSMVSVPEPENSAILLIVSVAACTCWDRRRRHALVCLFVCLRWEFPPPTVWLNQAFLRSNRIQIQRL